MECGSGFQKNDIFEFCKMVDLSFQEKENDGVKIESFL